MPTGRKSQETSTGPRGPSMYPRSFRQIVTRKKAYDHERGRLPNTYVVGVMKRQQGDV